MLFRNILIRAISSMRCLSLEAILEIGNFDGIGMIYDYMASEERHFNRLMSGIGNFLEKVENDEEIRAITEETGNPVPKQP